MANETMVLLEKIVVPSAGASSITFTSIPQSYTDLKIVVSARNNESDAAGGLFYVGLNGVSTNLSSRVLYGYGSGVGSLSSTAASAIFGYITSSGSTASTFGNAEIYIPNYTSSNNKSISVDAVNENNATDGRQDIVAGLWSSSSAITSITLYSSRLSDGAASGLFVQHSTFYLYGVAKQGVTPTNAPAATGGDSIVFDGTYWIHTFTSSGTFTPKKNLSCDYLVVAGGGAGGKGAGLAGGGGGAGGFRTGTGQSLTAQAYTITVGAGAPAPAQDVMGARGSDSVFDTITSTGGGSGGFGGGAGAPITGGSGGGGSSKQTVGAAGNTPSTSPSQGNNGGRGFTDNATFDNGGGGGGAGAVGQDGQNSSGGYAGAGGAGSASSISGVSVTYAGGGGGASYNGTQGAGGAGGGGNGSRTANGSGNGEVNKGGGGGGGGSGTGGSGGSGIVIVRYAA